MKLLFSSITLLVNRGVILFSESSFMDDYDPLDAFMEANEAQKEADDLKWKREVNPYRVSSKRGNDEIYMNPQEILLSGMQKPMTNSSFGLRMLQKMGYQQGEGLGKDGSGIKEPIQVKLKYDKLGIGHEEAEKKQQEEKEYEKNLRTIRRQLYYNQRKEQYQNHMKERQNTRYLSKDIRQAQSAIEMLDEDHGRPRNPLLLSNDEDCDIETLSAHLGKMIEYLRTTYCYCIYCGCSYNDQSDMNENCPGWDRDCH